MTQWQKASVANIYNLNPSKMEFQGGKQVDLGSCGFLLQSEVTEGQEEADEHRRVWTGVEVGGQEAVPGQLCKNTSVPSSISKSSVRF